MSVIPSDILSGLSDSQAELVKHIATSLRAPVEETVTKGSDIVTAKFAEDFRNRLVLYHALTEDPLKKKPFEFAFAGACRASSRKATVTASSTLAGRDVVVDGVAYSCKTEAAQGISRQVVKISKLMEARWIRECASGADFLRQVKARIVTHLADYERIVSLRAFRLANERYEYQLIEIPKDILMLVKKLRDVDFSPRTKNGSSTASVMLNSQQAFRLRLDGSVEKVTIDALSVDLCRQHAVWKVPIGGPANLG